MKTIRYEVTINGVKTAMLFTPRLFDFKTPSMDFSGGEATKVAGMYADIAYCAALNYWTLTDHAVENFQLTRLDFHEWSAQEPAEFGKVMRIAIEAITNKSLDELMKEGKNTTTADEEVKKKHSTSIIQRLKAFLSAIVGCRRSKRHGHR
jgi:hypothetical protein